MTDLLEEKNWAQLHTYFLDNSHTQLTNYFSQCSHFKVITTRGNRLYYQAKFPQQGEIGVISFNEKDGAFSDIRIKNQIKPLHYIKSFKTYPANNIKMDIGDAKIHFISGHFYESIPYKALLLFKGKWKIDIKPNDDEEQLTLKRQYKKDYFSVTKRVGIFIFEDKSFLKKLTAVDENTVLDKELQPLFERHRDYYGIKQAGEYWFLPFPSDSNFLMFNEDKKAKSFYYYTYNPNQVPDTQLSISENNNIILSYNRHKEMKMFFGSGNSVSGISMNVSLEPDQKFISGSSTIFYNRPGTTKEVFLEKGLRLMLTATLESQGFNVFRRGGRYYLLGPESSDITLFFKGNLKLEGDDIELFKKSTDASRRMAGKDTKEFYFLSRTRNFYPNPGDEFFKSEVQVKLPAHLNCLASGNLVSHDSDNTSYKFNCASTKGVSMVVGNFKKTKTVNARLPLHFYTYEGFRYSPRDLDLEEIKRAVNLFVDSFGPLDLSALNILLRRGVQEGGISNTGFVVLNLPASRVGKVDRTGIISTPITTVNSPIITRDKSEDHLMHEISHQWWGGLLSWKTYQDVWITEGLAHFSVLYFLKKTLPEKKFNRIVRKLKRWVFKHSEAGPIIYGTRLITLENKYETYQSVVYNKSALVFLMLMDIVGEEDFFKRLHVVMEKYKYKSLSSLQFIRSFSGENKMISDFFTKWIYTRALPMVKLELMENDEEYDKKDFKKIVLNVRQLNTECAFPYTLKISSLKTNTYKSYMMKGREMRVVVTAGSAIQSVTLGGGVAPVREKKDPPTGFKK
ncbi:MAG: M1 family metallopeptidase [bacterium]|nr:M1 family metallopeptidase [bacterium]